MQFETNNCYDNLVAMTTYSCDNLWSTDIDQCCFRSVCQQMLTVVVFSLDGRIVWTVNLPSGFRK